jgi:hypothetical protein
MQPCLGDLMLSLRSIFCQFLTIVCLGGLLAMPASAQMKTVDSSTWITFYDSLDVMKNELPIEARQALTEDVHAVDDYYFGQYADGVYTQEGDLRFKASLNGLTARQIHQLAVKLCKNN